MRTKVFDGALYIQATDVANWLDDQGRIADGNFISSAPARVLFDLANALRRWILDKSQQ